MEVVVFGATGFLGSHIARAFHEEGWRVTTPYRPEGRIPDDMESVSRWVPVDFRHADEVMAAVPRRVLVCNAIASPREKDPKLLREVELDLTERLIHAAHARQALGFLQLGSIISYGSRIPAEGIDETFPPDPDDLLSRVSLEREQRVARICRAAALPFAILQPVSCLGRGDRNTLSGHLMRAYQEGKFPLVGGGNAGLSLLDARDAGLAFVHVAQHLPELEGRKILVKGFDCSWSELKSALDRACGYRAGAWRPSWPTAWLMGLLSECLGLETRFSRRMARFIGRPRLFRDCAIRATGYRPRYGLDAAVASAIET